MPESLRAAGDEVALVASYLRHLADLRPADANGLRVAAADIEAGFHLDPALNPDAAPAPDEIVSMPMLETLREPFIVKRPCGELAPPDIGKHGGMSLGAHYMPGVGSVMSIAVHHPGGETLLSTFGWDGYAELAHAFNRWGARIQSGEFSKPPVAS